MKIKVKKGNNEHIANFFVEGTNVVFEVEGETHKTGYGSWMLVAGGGPKANSYKKMLRNSDYRFKELL